VVPATSEPVAPAPAFPKAAPVPKAEPGDIEKCKAHEGNLIFFDPEPKAGRRTTLFFNRAISDSLRHRDGIVVQFGYNYWRWENGEKAVKSSAVPKSDNADWLKATFEVPAEAYELNMVFKDREEENWENNNDQDFVWQIEDCITPEEFDLVLVRKAEEDEAERQRQIAEEARLKVEAEAEERRKAAEEQAARQAEARAEAKRKQEEQIARQKAKMEAEAARQKQLEEDAAEAAAREEERAIEQFLREEPEAQMRDRQAAEESIGQDRWQAEQASRDLPVTIKKRFFTKPQPQADKEFTLFYNSNETCMEGAFAIYLVYGFNNWYEYPEGKSKVVQMKMATKTETKSRGKGQWWKAKIKVPAWTYQLDFVTTTEEADGCGAYDNNGMQDYHCRVKHNIKADDWEDRITEKMAEMKKVRKLHEAEQIIKAGRRMARRSMTRAEAMESVRRSQAHTWYAEPATPQAGHSVRIFYNPEHTALNGAQEVYVRGGWNRWKHDQVWGPVIMDPAKESSGGHFVAELEVPMDAWCMDFVFSDSPAEAARYDNKKGLDYHLPVTGSSSKEPPMHIMHVAVEMAPIAKVGGLADVVTSISRAIIELGHTVEVVLPKYDCLDLGAVKNMRDDGGFQFGSTYWRVYRGEVVGVPTFFLGPESGDFSVGCIYGRGDDAARFEFFCHASLEFMLKTQRNPDIVHCHDWSTAPVARKLNEFYSGTPLGNTQSVFTLHNLNYGANLVGEAIKYCAMATTVSPTYAWEVGSNPAIAPGIDKFYGIRNGVDPDIWDPENDMWLAQHYTADTVRQGKSFNKRELQQRTGLKQEPDMPLVGIVTRLTAQKGISLIEHAIHKVLERGGQVVLLGTAPDSRVQEQFEGMRHVVEEGQNCKLILNYDEPLSHLIYAGADMICVPSMFEPCGLTQLIAMRFGSVPIVRKTGGLADTVFDVDHDKERCGWYGYEPNGFSFEGADTESLDYALNRALDSYYDAREWFQSLQKRCLTQDFTWNRPALEYMELYYQCAKWAALSAYYK
jgi:glycogen synthase